MGSKEGGLAAAESYGEMEMMARNTTVKFQDGSDDDSSTNGGDEVCNAFIFTHQSPGFKTC